MVLVVAEYHYTAMTIGTKTPYTIKYLTTAILNTVPWTDDFATKGFPTTATNQSHCSAKSIYLYGCFSYNYSTIPCISVLAILQTINLDAFYDLKGACLAIAHPTL